MTTLTEVVRTPAHPAEIRTAGARPPKRWRRRRSATRARIGGNVSQDARCWYYRAGWPCYRAGGNICYADTPDGRNREHAILHAERCVAVNPSDTAPALIALDAKFVIRTPKGERVISAEDYFVGPDIDITRLNILQPGDLLTSIRIPGDMGRRAVLFREDPRPARLGFSAAQRGLGDDVLGRTIERIRIAVNAVAARPLRLTAVEDAVTGKPRNAATGEMAGNLAVQGAVPLAVQRLQDPADAKSGEARHRRRAGGNMGVLQWATIPGDRAFPSTSRGS